MGKNFVLKAPGGRLAGCLMQGGGRILCKVCSNPPAGTQAVLLYEDGGETRHPLKEDSMESEWTDCGRGIRDVYIASGGVLLMASGDGARRAFERGGNHMPQNDRRNNAKPRESGAVPAGAAQTGFNKAEAKEDESADLAPEEPSLEESRGIAAEPGENALSERSWPDAIPGEMDETRETDPNVAQRERPSREERAHGLPERRWPPPPCMPSARYEQGKWTQREAASQENAGGNEEEELT